MKPVVKYAILTNSLQQQYSLILFIAKKKIVFVSEINKKNI